MNNKFNSRNNVNNNDEIRMSKNEKRALRGIIKKALVAITVILTVISRNLPAVISWAKALNKANDRQRLSLKGLLCTAMGEATLVGMPTAVRNLLQGMGAPRPIIALTENRKVKWLLVYIEDTYSMMDVKQLLTLTGQAAAIGATLESEINEKSYLPLDEHREMTCEEVENM